MKVTAAHLDTNLLSRTKTENLTESTKFSPKVSSYPHSVLPKISQADALEDSAMDYSHIFDGKCALIFVIDVLEEYKVLLV